MEHQWWFSLLQAAIIAAVYPTIHIGPSPQPLCAPGWCWGVKTRGVGAGVGAGVGGGQGGTDGRGTPLPVAEELRHTAGISTLGDGRC